MTTIQPLRRRLAAVSAPVLLAISLTACGGGGGSDAGGAPEDASTDEFCTAYQEFPDDFDSDDTGAAVGAANEYGDALAEVGTPEDFSAEARNGFETYIGFLQDVDEGDVDELEDSETPDDIFGDDGADVTTFITDATELCIGELGGDLSEEIPTEEPS